MIPYMITLDLGNDILNLSKIFIDVFTKVKMEAVLM